MADQAPFQTAVDRVDVAKGLILSEPWLRWFNYLSGLLNFVPNFTQNNKQVPLTGFSLTFADGQQIFQLVPAGVLATGTVTMAPTPINGQLAEIYTTQTVTGFTLLPNAGQTLLNAPTTLVAPGGIQYYYSTPDATWYRRM